MIDTETLTGIYVDIANNRPKAESVWADAEGFDETWDSMAAEMEEARAQPNFAGFDVPSEYGMPETPVDDGIPDNVRAAVVAAGEALNECTNFDFGTDEYRNAALAAQPLVEEAFRIASETPGTPEPILTLATNARDDLEIFLEVDDWMDPDEDDMLAMTASATAVPLDGFRPPTEWFSDPHLTETTPLTVTDEGRVYGHLADWQTCHTSHTAPGQCVLAPRSQSGYAYFRTGYVVTQDGTHVPVGRITRGTGHANERLNAQATMAHYDNTGTVAAFINVGEDRHGVWVAGCMAPTTTETDRVMLRATPLSGDWRRIKGSLDLVAALAVNVAGFPIPRPKGFVASGQMQTLVAAGMVPPSQVLPPGTEGALSTTDLKYLKRLASRERDEETAEMRRKVTLSSLTMRVRASRPK